MIISTNLWMKEIWWIVLVWLSIGQGLQRVHEFHFVRGQGEPKFCATGFVRLCPQPAPMGIDDGPADRQPHAHAAGFGGVEGLENTIEMFRIDPWPGIAHRHEDAVRLVRFGADQQLPGPSSTQTDAHGFDRVQDQVQYHLLHLNTIRLNGRQALSETLFNQDSDSWPLRFAPMQSRR